MYRPSTYFLWNGRYAKHMHSDASVYEASTQSTMKPLQDQVRIFSHQTRITDTFRSVILLRSKKSNLC
jgi:hypothetical protein